MSIKHFMYVPFTGLGLYGGFRGNTWLKNRITVFKQFVVPSLQAQTNQDFTIWVSWRPQERYNQQVKELEQYLFGVFGKDRVVFTYSGVCFWDDKYPRKEAHERLTTALHGALGTLINLMSADYILMTIQPSDDCYRTTAVQEIQNMLSRPEIDAVGYRKGYIMNYLTGEIREYNPLTIPPFFTIKFKREVFDDPFEHMKFTGPYESHEYIAKKLRFLDVPERGFLVGTHTNNISTHFTHPFAGSVVPEGTKGLFGLTDVPILNLKYSLWTGIMRKFPHRVQRKIRYLLGERCLARIYKLFN